MRLRCLLVVLALAGGAAARARAATTEGPLDYTLLTHVLAVESLRAGNHDPSGVNDYYFTATMYGLVNTSEERNLAFDKRKKLSVELGAFGDAKMDALSLWQPDEKTKDVKELHIDGNAVRELAARSMTELKAAEGDLAVMIDVTLWEREKRFIFFGEDRKVASVAYHPIPPTKFEQASPFRTNVTLTLTDDKGTVVKLDVRYDKPLTAPKPAATIGSP